MTRFRIYKVDHAGIPTRHGDIVASGYYAALQQHCNEASSRGAGVVGYYLVVDPTFNSSLIVATRLFKVEQPVPSYQIAQIFNPVQELTQQ